MYFFGRKLAKSLVGAGNVNVIRGLCTYENDIKITICGALGQIGKSLSVLLKQSPFIDELRLYDVKNTKNLATDLNLSFAKCKVIGCEGIGKEKEAFLGTNIVVLVASCTGQIALNSDEMFRANKKIIEQFANIYAKYCSKALIALATQPVNCFVPFLSNRLKAKGVYDPRKVFGVTTLYSERASQFVMEYLGPKSEKIEIPIVGGGLGRTVVPLLSTINPSTEIYYDELEEIHKNFLEENQDFLKSSSAAAYAVAKFVKSLVYALKGRSDIVECSYVKSDSVDGLDYLCTPLLLGPEGIHRNYGVPSMTLFEQDMFVNATKLLKEDIKKGELIV